MLLFCSLLLVFTGISCSYYSSYSIDAFLLEFKSFSGDSNDGDGAGSSVTGFDDFFDDYFSDFSSFFDSFLDAFSESYFGGFSDCFGTDDGSAADPPDAPFQWAFISARRSRGCYYFSDLIGFYDS